MYLLDKLTVMTTQGVAFHSVPSSSSVGVNSTTKSARACAVMAILGQYWTSTSLISIAQRSVLLVVLGLLMAFFNGLFVKMIMV